MKTIILALSLCYTISTHAQKEALEKNTLPVPACCKDSIRNGKIRTYNKDEKLEKKQNIENGQQDGKEICYHPNGKISIERHWKNGQLNGICKTYNPDGTLLQETEYADNKPVATFIRNGAEVEERRIITY